ncbi:MAG: diguanylate cyclase [Lachnospiraceae bacterium]|nr:diguanylate cyclase [Lachnospiraceae bacterium]
MTNKKPNDPKIKYGLKRRLRVMTVVPIILMGLVVAILGYYVFLNTIKLEVRRNLSNAAQSVSLFYDTSYPGDYSAEKYDDGTYTLYKGGVDISSTQPVLDKFTEKTKAKITLFYLDIRMLTTVTGPDGNRGLYTISNRTVSDAVINGQKEAFYDNITIDGVRYFTAYIPLFNSDGKCIGMLSAGKPAIEVEQESRRALLWVPIATFFMVLFAIVFSSFPANSIVKAINEEKKFLGEISKGNLNASLQKDITERTDELGDMGRFSRGVQKFLRDMIERDTLTRLYTRRVGASKIAYTQSQFNQAGVKYCVCMGDIDFFKKFNDNYGHDCGDLVLRDIASIFNEFMLGKGFAVRWGGEEFLIIFEDADLGKALTQLRTLRQKVLDHVLEYEGEKLSVTMTFGLTQGDTRDIEDIIKDADELLYLGKQNGRNRIVTPDDVRDITVDPDQKELLEIREK